MGTHTGAHKSKSVSLKKFGLSCVRAVVLGKGTIYIIGVEARAPTTYKKGFNLVFVLGLYVSKIACSCTRFLN